jgi:hypothetical protein
MFFKWMSGPSQQVGLYQNGFDNRSQLTGDPARACAPGETGLVSYPDYLFRRSLLNISY